EYAERRVTQRTALPPSFGTRKFPQYFKKQHYILEKKTNLLAHIDLIHMSYNMQGTFFLQFELEFITLIGIVEDWVFDNIEDELKMRFDSGKRRAICHATKWRKGLMIMEKTILRAIILIFSENIAV
ncbi:hypothetical protein ACJX0J_016667, partial [Zea mays]